MPSSTIEDFADYFKARKTPIERWYSDGEGRFAFRVTIHGQRFVCAARNTPPKDGRTSIMARVAGKAQTSDALLAIRLRDDIHVFEPVAVLGHGEADDVTEKRRKRRGEKWVTFPVSLGCTLEEWVDGGGEPVRFGDVREA